MMEVFIYYIILFQIFLISENGHVLPFKGIKRDGIKYGEKGKNPLRGPF